MSETGSVVETGLAEEKAAPPENTPEGRRATVLAALQAYDFTPIDSAEQLAELFVDEVGATRLDDEEMLGRRAVVIDMAGNPDVPVFRSVVLPDDAHPDVNVWYTQDYVRIWAIDTDDGVLIVTAEAANPDELAAALELHEQVRNTLELL